MAEPQMQRDWSFDKARVRALVEVLQPKRLTRIFDVGASPVNVPPYRGLLEAGLCEIWGFEPQEKEYQELVAAAGPHEHYIQGAVGDGAPALLNICLDSRFTSLLTPSTEFCDYLGCWHQMMRVLDQVKFDTVRLDDVNELPGPDLLKIDVQGGELAVFRNAVTKLAETPVIISEVALISLYEGQPLIGDQMSELMKQGFIFHKLQTFATQPLSTTSLANYIHRQSCGQAVDGDAVFLRRDMMIGKGSSERIKHMAILADAVFASPDVVSRCLDILIARQELSSDALEPYTRHLTV